YRHLPYEIGTPRAIMAQSRRYEKLAAGRQGADLAAAQAAISSIASMVAALTACTTHIPDQPLRRLGSRWLSAAAPSEPRPATAAAPLALFPPPPPPVRGPGVVPGRRRPEKKTTPALPVPPPANLDVAGAVPAIFHRLAFIPQPRDQRARHRFGGALGEHAGL